MFCERLKTFRIDNHLMKKELAEKLDISDSYYNLIESGKREPSKTVMYRLVLLSDMPEEYWRFGISDKDEIIEVRDDFKCFRAAFDYYYNIGELDKSVIENLFNKIEPENEMERMFLKGMKADAYHLYEKKKRQ